MFFAVEMSETELRRKKRRFYLAGAIMLLIGAASIAMPLAASFAIETALGLLLLCVGLCNAVSAFAGFKSGDKPVQETVMATVSFLAGAIFVLRPTAGVMTISFLLAAYFLVDGVVKIIGYFNIMKLGGSVWLLVSGVLGILLAFMMWKNVFTGAAVIGIILGLDLIVGGTALVFLGKGCAKCIEGLKAAKQPSAQLKDDGAKL